MMFLADSKIDPGLSPAGVLTPAWPDHDLLTPALPALVKPMRCLRFPRFVGLESDHAWFLRPPSPGKSPRV